LEKLRVQGWFEIFTNTQLGCSVAELAEFFANCSVTKGVELSQKLSQQTGLQTPQSVKKGDMSSLH